MNTNDYINFLSNYIYKNIGGDRDVDDLFLKFIYDYDLNIWGDKTDIEFIKKDGLKSMSFNDGL